MPTKPADRWIRLIAEPDGSQRRGQGEVGRLPPVLGIA